MKKVFQTKRGMGGNCLAACLASILEIPLDTIPDLAPPECFDNWEVQPRLRTKFLASRGLDYLEIDLEANPQHRWTDGGTPIGRPCLLVVESPTPELAAKGYCHYVVGEIRIREAVVLYHIFHDPLGPVKGPYKVKAVAFIVTVAAPMSPVEVEIRSGYREPVKFTATNRYGSGPDGEDDVYTIEEFKTNVESTAFVDYDGHGHPVMDGLSNPDIFIKPSRLDKIPSGATHIVWYNR